MREHRRQPEDHLSPIRPLRGWPRAKLYRDETARSHRRWRCDAFPRGLWQFSMFLMISFPVRHSTPVLRLKADRSRSEEHTSELQSRLHLVCRLLLEKKKNT